MSKNQRRVALFQNPLLVSGANRRGSVEIRPWRRTHRVEPAADVDLGVGLATKMSGTGRIGGFRTPAKDRQLRASALNDEPMHRVAVDDSADFTSILP
jgi:hypothetical protein